MNILGISAFYHDSAAALVRDGEIIAAAQEERFTRKKQDCDFPTQAIKYCLKEAGISLNEIDYVVFYEKPFIKFERLLETYFAFAPKGIISFLTAIPLWVKEKLFQKNLLFKNLDAIEKNWSKKGKLLFTEHHQSHAASAYYPSPFDKAIVITADGVGEWATTTVSIGEGNQLKLIREIDFPHSLGLLYSAFTYYTGFKVNSGEYKVMGLAPYGEPKYVEIIEKYLIDVKMDGSFQLNMEYFDYCTNLKMVNQKFCDLFGGPPRKQESPISQKDMDLAASIQQVLEKVLIRLVNHLVDELKIENLCLAGGVALNCVANGKIMRESKIKNLWIQPAAGDAGGALGAALSVWHEYLGNIRSIDVHDSMKGSFLGPQFSNSEIESFLKENNYRAHFYEDESLYQNIAKEISDENVIGWFQGRMEYGPRSLGSRSIIGDARSKKMQSVMNLKIKYRESFRPFAPSVLDYKADEWFDLNSRSPYMLLVAQVKSNKLKEISEEQRKLFGIEKLNIPRSEIPAVTHIDYSARVQSVHKETNPRYFHLIEHFNKLTGCPVIVNTSFNVRGEPIVCSPEDAYRCFMRTEMDTLVLGNYVLRKDEQKQVVSDSSWKKEFELD